MALDEALAKATLLGILLGFVALVTSLYQLYRLMKALGLHPEGEMFVATQLSIKAWAAAVLFYFGAGALLNSVGGVPVGIRRWLNVLLAWALVTQAVWATLAYRRWRLGSPRKRGRKRGGIE